MPKKWTQDETRTLTQNWDTKTIDEITRMLPNRSKQAVKSKAQRLQEKGRLGRKQKNRYPGPVESVGEVQRKPDTRVSPQQWRGYLPITFENGDTVDIPVEDVDVVDIPGEIDDANAVYWFDGHVVVDFGSHNGTDFELTYTPRTNEWEVRWADSDETLPYSEVIPRNAVLWRR